MAKVSQPELKRYLDKRVAVSIQGGRRVVGTLRGYDLFLNLVIDGAVEQVHPPAQGASTENGAGRATLQHKWVDAASCGTVVVRGNSVNSLEGLDVINTR